MHRRGIFAVLFALALAVPASFVFAQNKPAQQALPAAAAPMGRVGRVYTLHIKAGQGRAFEEGLKKHAAWHRAQKDAWTWEVWEGETGPATGQYIVGTFGHEWADFDKPSVPEEADGADWNTNVAPYVDSMEGIIVIALPEVSRFPTNMTPSKLVEVITIELNTGAGNEFMVAVRKVTEAIKKTNWIQTFEWHALASGGAHPTFYLVLPHDSWASMKEPDKSFEKMLEEAFGPEEAGLILKVFNRSIKIERSEVLRYRADLAYTQAK